MADTQATLRITVLADAAPLAALDDQIAALRSSLRSLNREFKATQDAAEGQQGAAQGVASAFQSAASAARDTASGVQQTAAAVSSATAQIEAHTGAVLEMAAAYGILRRQLSASAGPASYPSAYPSTPRAYRASNLLPDVYPVSGSSGGFIAGESGVAPNYPLLTASPEDEAQRAVAAQFASPPTTGMPLMLPAETPSSRADRLAEIKRRSDVNAMVAKARRVREESMRYQMPGEVSAAGDAESLRAQLAAAQQDYQNKSELLAALSGPATSKISPYRPGSNSGPSGMDGLRSSTNASRATVEALQAKLAEAEATERQFAAATAQAATAEHGMASASEEAATASSTLAASEETEETSASGLAGAYQRVKAAIFGVSTADEENAAANEVVTATQEADTAASFNRTRAYDSARVMATGATGSVYGLSYALSQAIAQSRIMGPVFAAAFNVAMVGAMVGIIADVGVKVYHLYENYVLLKGSIQAAATATDKLGQSTLTLQNQLVQATAAEIAETKGQHAANVYLAQQAQTKSLSLTSLLPGTKSLGGQIIQQTLTGLHGAPGAVIPYADLPRYLAAFQGARGGITQKLVAAQGQVESFKSQLRSPNITPSEATGVAFNLSRAQANVSRLEHAIQTVTLFVEDLKAKAKIHQANLGTIQYKAAHPSSIHADHMTSGGSASRPMSLHIYGRNRLGAHTTTLAEMESTSRHHQALIAEGAPSTPYMGTIGNVGAMSLGTSAPAVSGTSYAIANQLQLTEIRANAASGAISKLKEAEQIAAVHTRAFAEKMAELNNQIKIIDAEQGISGKSRQSQLAAVDRQKQQLAMGRIPQAAADQQAIGRHLMGTRALHLGFGTVNQSFTQMTKGILQGTESIQMAWQRMGTNLVLTFGLAMEKSAMKFLETRLRMVLTAATTQRGIEAAKNAAKAAGTAQSAALSSAGLAQQKAADSESRFSAARTAAANTFKDVVQGAAFLGPLAPVVAGVAAAGAFATVMAFAKGGVVPETNVALVHQNEMVLPAHLSSFVQSAAAAHSGGGSAGAPNIHFHYAPSVQAIDANGVQGMLNEHQDMFASSMMSYMREKNLA